MRAKVIGLKVKEAIRSPWLNAAMDLIDPQPGHWCPVIARIGHKTRPFVNPSLMNEIKLMAKKITTVNNFF